MVVVVMVDPDHLVFEGWEVSREGWTDGRIKGSRDVMSSIQHVCVCYCYV
jgi:hypothetical protein